MSSSLLRTLLSAVEAFRPVLTRPGFANALVVFAGWVLSQGRHAITEALVATDVARRRDHARFHRFFSRGTWSPDALGKVIFDRILRWVPLDGPIPIVLDDTLTPKKGPHVFGIGSHLDAVRSTRRFKVFTFGHVWVVLSVVVQFPFARRPWAIPVMFRIYRNLKECEGKGDTYRKKTELGREMVDLAATWAAGRRLHLATDAAYCNATVLKDLPTTVTVFGSIRPDAVLTAPPTTQPKRGRRRIRGERLPTPAALARNGRRPWEPHDAELYGTRRTQQCKTIDAQWYRGCGAQLVRIVVVRTDSGAVPLRVYLCTDPTLTVTTILETYAGRWALEVTFRDLKQHLGFADSSARKRQAVERTAPFVGFIYATLVLWFAESAHRSPLAAPPIRPWYRRKRYFSFADILRTAQRVLASADILDPARSIENLQNSTSRGASHADRRRAAAFKAQAQAA